MSDWLFAFFHLFLLAAILIYALVSLTKGNVFRFGLITAGLIVYYFIVLHKPVKREIERVKKKKS